MGLHLETSVSIGTDIGIHTHSPISDYTRYRPIALAFCT